MSVKIQSEIINRLDEIKHKRLWGDLTIKFKDGEVFAVETRQTEILTPKNGGNFGKRSE